ncbi:SGNH/GDSL hydrolase family protein [Candidatus Saccharibacteria bacterium]|nr:SGNH/GDSL hydrolase family protein [Candidatus Saccharibacteria bacterium]
MKKSALLILTLIISVIIPISNVVALDVQRTTNQPEPPSVVVLGDSIATGYRLTDYTAQPKPYARDSYVSILERKTNSSFLNLAEDGLTSGGLVEKIATISEQNSLAGDVFIISIGGNDLLQALFVAMAANLGVDPSAVTDRLLAIIAGGDIQAIMSIANLITNLSTDPIVELYSKNLEQIILELRTINPDARIIVQTIANPYKDISITNPAFRLFEDAVEAGIKSLNATINSGTGYLVADVYSTFARSTEVLTNATSIDMPFDPHPNQSGHAVIAGVVGQLIPYTITIDSSINGKVVADKVIALPGDLVTLTITPSDGYKLDSINLNGDKLYGEAFTMSAESVTITATFKARIGIVFYIIAGTFLLIAISIGAFFLIKNLRTRKTSVAS